MEQEYHERHGHDVCSFDLPSTHRLPTVSAAQALEDLDANVSRFVSTNLPDLDKALAASAVNATSSPPDGDNAGGIHKGHLTEIWGPPGVGKTAFGIQAAADVLRGGKGVVWVDCFYPVSRDRLTEVCRARAVGGEDAASDHTDGFVHYSCPSLAHFIALLCRPTRSCLPPGTDLIVIDSLSALLNHAFPRLPAQNAVPKASRLQVLQYVVSALQKLAATRDAAVVVLTQCATRMQAERGATLIPAINASVWEQGIATRVALLREWMWNDGHPYGARLAAVQKANGKTAADGLDRVFAFSIDSTGLAPAEFDGHAASSTLSGPKRKLGETGFEVADSEDEDYGWQEKDSSLLPGMPPQWQGSEDLILGQRNHETEGDSHVEDSELENDNLSADEQ
ncbi:P-loop containing nucleoside triphosphate hydrolase protein [Diaporthe sp. PMI_573]|nr:P-loop containing nucleoside triphosphate hydrolase protein [Diaporthaceae sp. PMI_573]